MFNKHKTKSKTVNNTVSTSSPKWDSTKQHDFVNNITDTTVVEITQQLKDCNEHATQDQLDSIINQLNSTFTNSASKTFTNKHTKFITKCKSHKPWYGLECKKARKCYNKLRKKYNKYPSEENRVLLKNASKKYKEIMINL